MTVYKSLSVGDGGSMISTKWGWEAKTEGNIFAENCMEMKEFGAASVVPTWILQCTVIYYYVWIHALRHVPDPLACFFPSIKFPQNLFGGLDQILDPQVHLQLLPDSDRLHTASNCS